jgi:hypothetical protein
MYCWQCDPLVPLVGPAAQQYNRASVQHCNTQMNQTYTMHCQELFIPFVCLGGQQHSSLAVQHTTDCRVQGAAIIVATP